MQIHCQLWQSVIVTNHAAVTRKRTKDIWRLWNYYFKLAESAWRQSQLFFPRCPSQEGSPTNCREQPALDDLLGFGPPMFAAPRSQSCYGCCAQVEGHYIWRTGRRRERFEHDQQKSERDLFFDLWPIDWSSGGVLRSRNWSMLSCFGTELILWLQALYGSDVLLTCALLKSSLSWHSAWKAWEACSMKALTHQTFVYKNWSTNSRRFGNICCMLECSANKGSLQTSILIVASTMGFKYVFVPASPNDDMQAFFPCNADMYSCSTPQSIGPTKTLLQESKEPLSFWFACCVVLISSLRVSK